MPRSQLVSTMWRPKLSATAGHDSFTFGLPTVGIIDNRKQAFRSHPTVRTILLWILPTAGRSWAFDASASANVLSTPLRMAKTSGIRAHATTDALGRERGFRHTAAQAAPGPRNQPHLRQ